MSFYNKVRYFQIAISSVFIAIQLASCSRLETKETTGKPLKIIQIDPTEMKNKQAYKVSQLIDTFNVVKLDSRPDAIIGQIAKMRIADNHIFIYDNYANALLIFDIKGKFAAKIQRKGKGPEEYFRIADFTINTKAQQVVIADDVGRKLISYDYSGEFVRRIIVPKFFFSKIAYTSDDCYLLFNQYQEADPKKTFNFYKINQAGEVLWASFPYKVDMTRVAWSKANFLTSYGADILYLPLNENVIYEYSKDIFKPRYRIDFGRFNLSEDQLFRPNIISLEDKVLHIERFNENSRSISLSYAFRRKLPDLIIDKKSGNVLYYTTFQFDKPFLAFGSPIIETFNDFLISVLPPSEIAKRIGLFKTISGSNNIENDLLTYNKGLKNLSRINKMDNPVLFFYKFKHF